MFLLCYFSLLLLFSGAGCWSLHFRWLIIAVGLLFHVVRSFLSLAGLCHGRHGCCLYGICWIYFPYDCILSFWVDVMSEFLHAMSLFLSWMGNIFIHRSIVVNFFSFSISCYCLVLVIKSSLAVCGGWWFLCFRLSPLFSFCRNY